MDDFTAPEFMRAVGLIGGSRLAAALGVTPQYVSKMKRQALFDSRYRVKAEWAVIIERETGGAVTRQQLRPDLWPQDVTEVSA